MKKIFVILGVVSTVLFGLYILGCGPGMKNSEAPLDNVPRQPLGRFCLIPKTTLIKV